MKEKIKEFWVILKNPIWIWIVFLIMVIGFILLYISEGQFPNMPLSSGIVAFISAVIGVVLTIAVTQSLLIHQTKNEAENDKDIRVFQKTIQVYSKFIGEMWEMISDDSQSSKISSDKLINLRTLCFKELVFYLKQEQLDEMAELIKIITPKEESAQKIQYAMSDITAILQKSIFSKDEKKKTSKEEFKKLNLRTLYGAFRIESKKDEEKQDDQDNQDNYSPEVSDNKDVQKLKSENNQAPISDPTFWHFIMLDDNQLKVFEKKDDWFLSLIEYGDDSKTNKLRQVNPNDVVFLFRRGGFGYIGVFKVTGYKIINAKKDVLEWKYVGEKEAVEIKLDKKDIEKYDIYNALQDGADYVSNILVEPLAYNFKGIGYKTVRRRTIERFVNDPNTINYYLDKFNLLKIDENNLNENTIVNIVPENQKFFNNLFEIKYLNNFRKVFALKTKIENIENKNIEGLNIFIYDNRSLVHEYSFNENSKENIFINTYIDDNYQWKIYLSDGQNNSGRIENLFSEILKKFNMQKYDGDSRYSTNVFNSDEIVTVLIDFRKMVEDVIIKQKSIEQN